MSKQIRFLTAVAPLRFENPMNTDEKVSLDSSLLVEACCVSMLFVAVTGDSRENKRLGEKRYSSRHLLAR